MKRWAVLLLLLVATPTLAIPPDQLPSPRPHGWVRDTARVLDPGTLERINRRLETLNQETENEVAVVTVESSEGLSSKQYATELFNRWGIGQRGVNNGVLLIAFMNEHRLEIETGEGARKRLTDRECSRILETIVVPSFKHHRSAAGMESGVEAICSVLTLPPGKAEVDRLVDSLKRHHVTVIFKEDPNSRQIVESARAELGSKPRCLVVARDPRRKQSGLAWSTDLKHVLSGINPTVSGVAYADLVPVLERLERGTRPAPPKTPSHHVQAPPPSHSGGFSPWFLLIGLVGGGSSLYAFLRFRPRKCPNCRLRLHRLREDLDDLHLDRAQILEEQLGSVDYDVWVCKSCDYKNILAWSAWLTGFSGCSSCSRRTLEKTGDRVLESATTYSDGRGSRDYYCRNCGYSYSEHYTISRIQESSSSSDSSSSSSSSYDSGSSSGFGGGESSGGGSGASW